MKPRVLAQYQIGLAVVRHHPAAGHTQSRGPSAISFRYSRCVVLLFSSYASHYTPHMPVVLSVHMSILQSLILGIIEGVTEFLPISSTGHLILASSLFGIAQNEFAKTFDIAIQLGAI